MKSMIRITLAAAIIAATPTAFAAQPLVDVAWVKENLETKGIRFLDVRGKLAGKSKADYLRAHIPGAVHTNYLKDGWRAKDKSGVAGQLAPIPKLEKLIGSLGISNDTHVVVIPNGGKALDMGTATRIYWTMKVLGHDKISLLDGGMNAYTKEVDKKTKKPVNPLAKGAVKPEPATFKANLRKEMLVTKEDVMKAQKGGVQIVDHRPNSQFLGINKHPLAKKAGTIPGAKNMPENWLTMNGGGSFRKRDSLASLYTAARVDSGKPQINFCNTGHWASLGWFVSHEIMGNKNAKMYDGSMLEWTADSSLPLEQQVKLN